MSNDRIAQTLNLQPIENEYALVEAAPTEDADSYDMELARQNIHGLLQKGSKSLDDLLELSSQGQSIKGYEAATALIKTLSEINKDLIELQEKKKKLSIKDEDSTVTNNNTLNFYGSTADFQQMIKKIKDGSDV